jgi:hypothetical protein
VNQDIIKYKRLERFLNKIEFKKIKVGSLLAQALELNYYNETKLSYIKYLLVFLKYSLTLPFSKTLKHKESAFLFTKLDNRFHFNELMDSLILHYLSKSTIICNNQSFDPKLSEVYPVYSRAISPGKTLLNSRRDSWGIFITTVMVLLALIKYKKRLLISSNEIFCYVNNALFQLRKSSYWNDYFKKCVIKPKCIITEFARNSTASPMVLNAKKYDIFTITLTHGVVLEYGIVPILADHIFCWGQAQKRQLINLGISPDRISVTGNPMIKNFNKSPGKNLLSMDITIVCLAISPEADQINKSLIENFILAIQQLENVNGIIKLHPSLEKVKYKWVNLLSSKITIYESTEIANQELFKVIDLLIVHFSGIVNEAFAAGTPVVILEPSGSSNLDFFQKELNQNAGCAVAVNSTDLVEIFTEYKANPELFRMRSIQKREHYLMDMFEMTGEESVRAMISEIDKLSENGKDEFGKL